jgi:vitamin B12 transporter
MLTKRGADELGAEVGLEYGEHATRKLDAALSAGSDRGDYYVSVTDFTTDGFNSQTADTVLRDDDGDDNTTLHAKLGWNVSEIVRLQLVAREVDADTAYDGCFSSTFTTEHDCRGATQQTTYKVSAEHVAGGFSNAFGYSNVDIVRDNFALGQSAFLTEGGLSRFEYTGSYTPGDSLTKVVYGLDFQDEGIVDADGRRSRNQQGYYAEYQHDFENALFVSLGARYDDNEAFGSHTSSRLSVVYRNDLDLGRALKYRASVGTGFRAPSMFEIAYNAGPFALPPAAGVSLVEEQSRGYDVGIEYEGNIVKTEVTYFDQRIEDEIYFDLTTFAGYLQSPGKSTSKGVEVAAEMALRQWHVFANWTYNEAESSTNEQRLRRPKSIGNLGAWFRSFNDVVRIIVNYRLARDSLDIGGVALDDYAVLDLSATYRLNDHVEIHGRIQNLADESYQEILGHNTAGRSANAGVRLRF